MARRPPKPDGVTSRPRHKGSGTPKPKLQHLTTGALTPDEIAALTNSFYDASQPIVVAILGQALIEYEIDRHIRRKLRHRDDATWERLTADSGPLSTFSRKIALGHALGIYDKRLRDDIDIVRKIRNVFAHAKRILDFENPAIREALKEVPAKRGDAKRYRDAAGQLLFIYLCTTCTVRLKNIEIRRLHSVRRRYERKNAKRPLGGNPFAGALGFVSGKGAPQGGVVNALARHLLRQTDGPTPQALEGEIFGLFGRQKPPDDSEGK